MNDNISNLNSKRIMDELNFENGIEIISKRGKREKHFLQKDGSIIAKMYSDIIHFKKDGKYVDIDNTLEKYGDYYRPRANYFNVQFKKNSLGKMMTYKIENKKMSVYTLECNDVPICVQSNKSQYEQSVKYKNIFNGIDMEYILLPNKVKENIIIQNRSSVKNNIRFFIETKLDLSLEDNKIVASAGKSDIAFFNTPYMIDSNGTVNNNLFYKLEKCTNGYYLNIVLDENWLMDNNIVYPVIIDPTISTYDLSLCDTYIYPDDINDIRYNKNILKAGVERLNTGDVVNRTLLKFELPTIGTGCQVCSAFLSLVGYYPTTENYTYKFVDVYRINTDWTEAGANWNNMNDKYDSDKIYASAKVSRSIVDSSWNMIPYSQKIDITSLVQRWYTDLPNYGIMIKSHKEEYQSGDFPAFFSKDTVTSGYIPKPQLIIKYRNYNGIENNMNLQSQTFENGIVYENLFNGNVIGMFNVGSTINGKLPINLGLVYNTHDVILNKNIGLGIGYRLSLYRTIEKETIDNIDYLKYTDDNGTEHYFILDNDIYRDEDNLKMTIEDKNNEYILTDYDGNCMRFLKNGDIGYLSEFRNVFGKSIQVLYDENYRIIRIVDGSNNQINITYNIDCIKIESSYKTVYLDYNSNKLIGIRYHNGSINFTYNNYGLIESITDINGTSIVIEYYEQMSHKVKKLKEYGKNGSLGASFEMKYAFKSSTLIDNNNTSITYNFDNNANTISTNTMKSNNDVIDGYGMVSNYGETEQYKNRLISNKIPVKYIKNYLKNICFENESIYFITDDNITISISDDECYEGKKSLKLTGEDCGKAFQSINVPKGKYYTFSAFVKSMNNFQFSLSYEHGNNEVITSVSEVISNSNNFQRYDVTIFYPEDSTSELYMNLILLSPGTVFIDNVQLEDGETVNNFNYIENSDFYSGTNNWTLESSNRNINDCFEVVNICNSNKKALKINMDPEDYTRISSNVSLSGETGDEFTISFWYKNKGIDCPFFNSVLVGFNYTDEITTDTHPEVLLNPNDNDWQFYLSTITAKANYNGINIELFQYEDANELYITNVSFHKNIASQRFDYDLNGNLISITNLNRDMVNFKYDKQNQIDNMLNQKGKRVMFEYDKNTKNKILNSISEKGISSGINYNNDGLPISNKITNKRFMKNIIEASYLIRPKGSKKYFRCVDNNICLDDNIYKPDLWYIIPENGSYKVSHYIIKRKNFSFFNNKLILANMSSNNYLFNFVKKENGSFLIQKKDSELYLKYHDDKLFFDNLSAETSDYEFIIEKPNKDCFIETTAYYTEDGNFINEIIDSNFRKQKYEYDYDTGLLLSIIDKKNRSINYIYDDAKRLISVINKDRYVNYVYNNENLLQEINQRNRHYHFIYDEFLNTKQIKISDNHVYLTNTYEQENGKLKTLKFGNGHELKYDYDVFGRIIKIENMDNVYNLKYSNVGELSKVISDNGTIDYYYDYGKRLIKYKNNEFIINYKYDKCNNITNKIYNLDGMINTISHEYNEDDAIIKTYFNENNCLEYAYDELGRLVGSTLGGYYNVNYSYVSNGKRETYLVSSKTMNSNKYSYKYNNMGKITHIYYNDVLQYTYNYDEYEQLISENDYIRNYTIRYSYDFYGNIIDVLICNMDTFDVIRRFKYEYNNYDLPDLLTKYDGEVITYDEIGNPITIGNEVRLNWINGRQLKSYIDNDKTINYKYDRSGTRISKKVNNKITNYYLENNSVILEKCDNDVLYFIRNDVDDLIAFKYNDALYYYVKNNNDDIVGLLDSQGNIVATYEYDSWGNILAIKDTYNNNVENNPNHIANINPFRYRSYYYDRETGFYYLKSRYYNPKWRRFINADGSIVQNNNISGYNLFSYVDNDPINKIDPNGNWSLLKGISSLLKKAKKYVKKIVKYTAALIVKSVDRIASKYVPGYNAAKNFVSTAVKTVSCISKVIFPASSDLLYHSAQSNPSNLYYNSSSQIAKAIKKDKTFQDKLIEIAKENPNGSFEVKVDNFSFDNDLDLKLAIHGTESFVVNGNLTDGKGKMEATITDTYNFELWTKEDHPNQSNFVINVNNIGFILFEMGVINDYKTTITINYVME